jgi:hypothetical protein
MLSAEAMAYEAQLTGNPEHRRILREGFKTAVTRGGGDGFGKSLGQMTFFAPYALGALEEVNEPEAGCVGFCQARVPVRGKVRGGARNRLTHRSGRFLDCSNIRTDGILHDLRADQCSDLAAESNAGRLPPRCPVRG